MSVAALVGELLTGVELDQEQLGELRAINSLYYTELAKSEGRSSEAGSALDNLVLARVREMLRSEQRARFDRNRVVVLARADRYGARVERGL